MTASTPFADIHIRAIVRPLRAEVLSFRGQTVVHVSGHCLNSIGAFHHHKIGWEAANHAIQGRFQRLAVSRPSVHGNLQ
ncbi:hypothetical protein [uncultured Parasphingorhabdus sp.]|uniref:hypothetical protein n=1 Tax=uncultured Parasphingorhabdus sp. TaxID=2709694 RepID=UPI0030D90FBF|tara:strand:- start:1387 stop:1623 length:237 start_codon:yes stop_codon:yes gene_type:complete